MYKITQHPIIDTKPKETVEFEYEGIKIVGRKGNSIASALHEAGFPVHSHSIKNRKRSLECGIGKCGACEMLVDGKIRRICITKVDSVHVVKEIPRDFKPEPNRSHAEQLMPVNIYRTKVCIVGAGPAGLATRSVLQEYGIENIVIDIHDEVGGQFNMQTHRFFFFETKKKFGGMRGGEIAKSLTENHDGIFLNCTVWEILDNQRVAAKNIQTEEIFYIESEFLVVATGAIPYLPNFVNDDLPGVYTAAVVQKMMNIELTLLGKNILTVGAGNIGYLTSYQLIQASAKIKAIIEMRPKTGGFPVQENRIRRLGIPVFTSTILLEAVPNKQKDGIQAAIVARAENFKAIPGTEKIISGIDMINICTGLVSDDALFVKGKEIFGRNCFSAGDAMRIGEGTSALLKGKQVAYDILHELGIQFDFDNYLSISKQYIDSLQSPIKIIEKPQNPLGIRKLVKPFVLIDCLYGFACNPCVFACPQKAIKKESTSSVPVVDFDKCTGCMECVYQCPGLAIFGYNIAKNKVFLPCEFEVHSGSSVAFVDDQGKIVGSGYIEKVIEKEGKTKIVRAKVDDLFGDDLLSIRGFVGTAFQNQSILEDCSYIEKHGNFICHCEDVQLSEVSEVIGNRKFISVDEVKHLTRLGMGACRGKRCMIRLKQSLKELGIQLVGEPTPRGPLSNQISLGELYPHQVLEKVIVQRQVKKRPQGMEEIIETDAFIAGGGIAGSALFYEFSQRGIQPVLANSGHGSSWRNIAGGRPAFSLPELSEIASQNLSLFKKIQEVHDIDFHETQYISFAHDEASLNALEKSKSWQKAEMILPQDFKLKISPFYNTNSGKYVAALLSENCWQANPGKVIDFLRNSAIEKGGKVWEDSKIIDIEKDSKEYRILVLCHDKKYRIFATENFINAMGEEGELFARKLGIETGLFPVKHQAFISRRLPFLGCDKKPLGMLIDRRNYKGFSAVYGQQLFDTGQIIGCASPANESKYAWGNLKTNAKEFLEIIAETFIDWIPDLESVGFQAVWSGYYIEPRMIIDPKQGLFLGLRGQGFMLGQYLAKLYVDSIFGKIVPDYFSRLSLQKDGLQEKSFS